MPLFERHSTARCMFALTLAAALVLPATASSQTPSSADPPNASSASPAPSPSTAPSTSGASNTPSASPAPLDAAQTPSAPPTPSAQALPLVVVTAGAPDDVLHPAPGRVPLIIESPRAPQTIGLTIDRPQFRIDRDNVCVTPCQLFVPRGFLMLSSLGRGIAAEDHPVNIPATGALLRLRAPVESTRVAGRTLAVVGFLAAITGTVLLITGASDTSGGRWDSGTTALFVSGGLTLGVAAALMIPGFVFLSRSRGGIEYAGLPPLPRE